MVTLAVALLATGLPTRLQSNGPVAMATQFLELLGFVVAYALIQLPFDLLGGYLLPQRFGRSFPPLAKWLAVISRGVAVHSAVLFLTAAAILVCGRFGGRPGTVAAGLVVMVVLLSQRVPLASCVARLSFRQGSFAKSAKGAEPGLVLAESADEGFTGGIPGLFGAGSPILPERWLADLGRENFEIALARRRLAVGSGGWWRGRIFAMLFTLLGLVAAAWLVPSALVGTAGGTIQFSLWFTLWSFVGLLILPTFSRRAVTELDQRLIANGTSPEALAQTTRLLDDLQDGEPVRPGFVETIFHPIPGVQKRVSRPRGEGATRGNGCWDVARTSVYLSLAGIGLLGRAVHCNCGRPSLWVFLPTD